MLHPVYSLRQQGIKTEYSSQMASGALRKFLKSFADGEEEYIHSMRMMYSYIYERSKAKSGKKYFLDKTPRYYFIIPELRRIFPNAKFLFLVRNPAAVLISIINTWIIENWFYLYEFKSDLMHALEFIINAMDHMGDQCHMVHYEKFVSNADKEIQIICNFLEVDIFPEMIDYGMQNLPKWHLGDQDKVHQHVRPNVQIAEKWVDLLKNPQVYRLALEYVNYLGQDLFKTLGYDFSSVIKKIRSFKSSSFHNLFTYSLISLLKKSPNQRNLFERYLKRINAAIIRSGSMDTEK
jgi:hypothetical protein